MGRTAAEGRLDEPRFARAVDSSAFAVTLPLVAVAVTHEAGDRAHPGVDIARLDEPRPSLVGVRVLVVDDDGDARDLLAVVLTQHEAEVRTAGSAAEGLAELTRWRPDALVSDIGMPGEDGYGFIARVRALPDEQGGRVPAVALTAYARAEDRRNILSAGYQMHLPMPVDPTELVAVVASPTGRVTEKPERDYLHEFPALQRRARSRFAGRPCGPIDSHPSPLSLYMSERRLYANLM